jgi:hypothetical protein
MLRGGNGVIIAADGATYDDDGVFRGLISKIHHLPGLDCAIAQVGAGGLSLALLQVMGHKYRSFDQMLEGIADDLRIASTWGMLHYVAMGRKPDSTVAIAGYSSARERYELYRISNWDKEIVDHTRAKAYELVPLDGFWANCLPTDDMIERFHLTGEAISSDPWSGLARWVCACRPQSRGPDPDLALPAFGCGGFVELAVLRQGQFDSRVVHRWPDEVGKRIDATVGDLVPDWMVYEEGESVT